MKVAYNSCFGGFGLSPLGLTTFAKKKGISLTWYKQTGYAHNGDESYERVSDTPTSKSWSYHPLTQDRGEVINELPNGLFYYPDFYDEARADPDLISTIEELGELADGDCADLAIEEIPDGSNYEITDYDGNESVVPPRMNW